MTIAPAKGKRGLFARRLKRTWPLYMLLIPGLATTNSVRDIMVGDTISGIMRLIECLLWAAALAFGFMIAIRLTGGLSV